MSAYRTAAVKPLERCRGVLFKFAEHDVGKLYGDGLCYSCWDYVYCMAVIMGTKKRPNA